MYMEDDRVNSVIISDEAKKLAELVYEDADKSAGYRVEPAIVVKYLMAGWAESVVSLCDEISDLKNRLTKLEGKK